MPYKTREEREAAVSSVLHVLSRMPKHDLLHMKKIGAETLADPTSKFNSTANQLNSLVDEYLDDSHRPHPAGALKVADLIVK